MVGSVNIFGNDIPSVSSRVGAYIVGGVVFLAAGQLWAGSVDRNAIEAGIAADSASVRAERTVKAITRTRARVLHVSDSLGAEVVLAEGRAAEAAHRASQAVAVADSISIESGDTTTEFRVSLTEAQVPSFEALVARFDLRHEQMQIAVSEKGAEVVSLEQALRTSSTIIEGLRAQIAREVMAQASLEEALTASQAEADGWKKAAHPGFVLGLWKDLPKLLAVGGAAYLYGRSGGE